MKPTRALVFLQLLLLGAVAVSATDTEDNVATTSRRQIPGGIMIQDPTKPIYKELAKKSLSHYMNDHSLIEPHEVLEVNKVTTQIVSGLLYRIDFSGFIGYVPVTCHSEIWEQTWLNSQKFNVTCTYITQEPKNEPAYGGETDKDVNDPRYKTLAEESLQKYVSDNGLPEAYRILLLKRVTLQVVEGFITRIYFDALIGSQPVTCHSKVYEKAWLNYKDIQVNCEDLELNSQQTLPGGVVEDDPSNSVYKSLALKALEKYKKDNGITVCYNLVHILKATKQVVAGMVYRIDFEARSAYGEDIVCHSEIYQRQWLNEETITVDCVYM